jgi:hypothetical protein
MKKLIPLLALTIALVGCETKQTDIYEIIGNDIGVIYPDVTETPKIGIKMLPVEDQSPFLVRLGNSLRPTFETSAAGTSLVVDNSGAIVSGGARTDDFSSYIQSQWEDFTTGRRYIFGFNMGTDY